MNGKVPCKLLLIEKERIWGWVWKVVLTCHWIELGKLHCWISKLLITWIVLRRVVGVLVHYYSKSWVIDERVGMVHMRKAVWRGHFGKWIHLINSIEVEMSRLYLRSLKHWLSFACFFGTWKERTKAGVSLNALWLVVLVLWRKSDLSVLRREVIL
jgi:hypothetical protein